MKTAIFITGLVVASFALQAQTDTTSNKKEVKAKANKTPAALQEQKSQPTKDMVKVKPSSIPKGLTKTLTESQYTGWEKGSLYFDTKTQEYALLMPTLTSEEENMKHNRDITAKKTPEHTGWYFFTKEGTPISN